MPKKADLCDDRIQRKQKLQKINFMLDNPNRQETRLPSKWQQEEAAGRCTLNLRGLFTREIWGLEKLVSTTTWNHNDNGYSFSTQYITGLFNVPKNGLDFLLLIYIK